MAKIDALINLKTSFQVDSNAVGNLRKQLEQSVQNINVTPSIKNLSGDKLAKEQKKIENSMFSLEGSIENVNKKLLKTENIIKTSSWNELDNKLKKIQQDFENISTETDLTKKSQSIDDLNKQIKSLNREVDKASLTQKDLGKEITNNIQKFTKWTTASTIVMKLVQLLKKMVDTVIQLDKAFTSIQMVTGYNNEQIEKLKDSYNDLAQSLKVSTMEVSSAGEEWLRQGLSIEDTNTALVASIKFAKVAAISTADATKLLTSAMKGYGLQVQSLLSIADKLNAVDMAAAVSAADLATAMSETAASAKAAGIQMDSLIGYLAVMQEVTQDSAETIGNSMKTILARMNQVAAGVDVDEFGESLNNVEKVLTRFGISLRNTNGDMRNTEVVLDEVAGRWGKLTKSQQNQVATAIAGTRQQEKFRVLMENYSRAIDLADESLNSLGTTTNKYGVYLESVEASVNNVKSSFEELSSLTIESGGIKSILNIIASIIKLLNSIEALLMPFQLVADVVEQISLALDLVIKPIEKLFNLLNGVSGGIGGRIIKDLVNPFAMLHEILGGINKGLNWLVDGITHLFGGKTQEEIEAITEKINNLGSAYDQYAELVAQTELSTIQSKTLEKLKKDMEKNSKAYRDYIAAGMDANEAYFRANIEMRAELSKSIGKDSFLGKRGVEDALVELQVFYTDWAKLSMYQKKEGITSLQAQIDQVEKLADTYPELKSWIQEIIDGYQEQLDAAKEYDPFAYEIKQIKSQLEQERDLWKEEQKAQKKKNELLQKELDVQEKLEALAQAQRKRARVYRAGRGFVYEADFSAVSEAQKALKSAQEELDRYKKETYYETAIKDLENLGEAESEFWINSENGMQDWYNKNAKAYKDNANNYAEMIAKMKRISKESGISYEGTSLGEIIKNYKPTVETHHNGGIVGATGSLRTGGNLKSDEILTKLQKGEMVLNRSGKNNLINALTSGSNETINVGNISLPNVTNANQFVNELKSIGRMSLQKATSHK